MAKTIRSKRGNCIVEIREVGGRITMKCKNLKRPPNAQEIIDSVKHKIIIK